MEEIKMEGRVGRIDKWKGREGEGGKEGIKAGK